MKLTTVAGGEQAGVALFLVAYPIALEQATRLTWPKAITGGVLGFLVFQGLELVFIR